MNFPYQTPINVNNINWFFDTLSQIDRNAPIKRLSYIAVKKYDTWFLLRGRLDFNPFPSANAPRPIHGKAVRAGTVDLSEAKLTPHQLLQQLFDGQLRLPGLPVDFPKSGSHHTAWKLEDVHMRAGARPIENRLQVSGVMNEQILEWGDVARDLKGLPGYYGDLNRLLGEYDFPKHYDYNGAGFWFVSLPVARLAGIDQSKDRVTFIVHVRPGYDHRLVTVGVVTRDGTAAPVDLTHEDFEWRLADDVWTGSGTVKASDQAMLEVIINYDGALQEVAHPNGTAPMEIETSSADVTNLSQEKAPSPVGAKGPARKRIKQSVAIALYAVSKNQCAYIGCGEPLVLRGRSHANIAHIKAAQKGGPRYDETQTDDERRAAENLLLLCPNHHGLIDKDVAGHPVELLQEMKNAHERPPPRDVGRAGDSLAKA